MLAVVMVGVAQCRWFNSTQPHHEEAPSRRGFFGFVEVIVFRNTNKWPVSVSYTLEGPYASDSQVA
jgi:hypothetical protein